MDSSTSRATAAQKRQEELKAKIAALQAELEDVPTVESVIVTPHSPKSKRKSPEPTLLVPATPSPKKKRRIGGKDDVRSYASQTKFAQPSFNNNNNNKNKKPELSSGSSISRNKSKSNTTPPNIIIEKTEPQTSNFLNKLAQAKSRSGQSSTPDPIIRTSAFSDKSRPNPNPNPPTDGTDLGLKRDDRLVLVEELERGPYEFTPPSNDPNFETIEPHSDIRLLKRMIPHEDFQEYLNARYYISPSNLYSIIRLLPDKQGYDVPLYGDWVTIAVVAERGPLKFTRAPVTLDPEDQDKKNPWKKDKDKDKDKKSEEEDKKKSGGKKYVNIKLIDFGARSKSSANGAQSTIRGDAFLTLLLFESDSFDLVQMGNGEKPKKLYKGGSKGAFEMMAKVKEGDVVAFLNPKILKPFQRSGDSPHPVNNILALTPESADSIIIIGRSRDLGMCSVVKKDGKTCGSWCDKRVSEVCEYHLQNAVQHKRAGRAEFTAGTSGMSTTAVYKRRNDYDPTKQWGLKPENTSGGSTYVIKGHVVSGSSMDPRNLYVGENMGREGQAKAQRVSAADADRQLKALLRKDRQGMKAVIMARESAKAKGSGSSKKLKGKEERRTTSLELDSDDSDEEEEEGLGEQSQVSGKNAFNAQVVKQLGFDPTIKGGKQKIDNTAVQKKLEALQNIRKSRPEVKLGSRPGPKIRSGVIAPIKQDKDHELGVEKMRDMNEGDGMIDLDDF